jgi:hypothetical protein
MPFKKEDLSATFYSEESKESEKDSSKQDNLYFYFNLVQLFVVVT